MSASPLPCCDSSSFSSDVRHGTDETLREALFANIKETADTVERNQILLFPTGGPLTSVTVAWSPDENQEGKECCRRDELSKTYEQLNTKHTVLDGSSGSGKWEIFANSYCQAISLPLNELMANAAQLLQKLDLHDRERIESEFQKLLKVAVDRISPYDTNGLKCYMVLVLFKHDCDLSLIDHIMLKYRPKMSKIITMITCPSAVSDECPCDVLVYLNGLKNSNPEELKHSLSSVDSLKLTKWMQDENKSGLVMGLSSYKKNKFMIYVIYSI